MIFMEDDTAATNPICCVLARLTCGASAGKGRPFKPTMTSMAMTRMRLGQTRRPQAPLIVDVRTPVVFGVAHVPGAVNIPLADLDKRLDELRQDHGNGVLIYCLNGARTLQAEPILYTHDIDNVYHLEGSLEGWLQKNYPIEKGNNRKAGSVRRKSGKDAKMMPEYVRTR
jgi:rhodanese-related sulfurtransferase